MTLISNTQDFAALLADIGTLNAQETIALDTESTGTAIWTKDVLRGVCIGYRGKAFYVSVSHPDSPNITPEQQTHLRDALQGCLAMPVFHNAPFDWRTLETGLDYTPPMERYRDTMVVAWLEDENARKGLKVLGARFFGEDAAAEQRHLKSLMKPETKAAAYKRGREAGLSVADAKLVEPIPGKTWATLTAGDIAEYAAADAALTDRVYHHLLAQSEYAAVEPAVQKQHDVQAAAYRMTRRGVAIDVERAVTLAEDAEDTASIITAQFRAEYGVEISSNPQLAVLLFETWGLPATELTEGGKPSVAAAVLESMAGAHPGLDRVLEYRRLTKARQFYGKLLDHADDAGRIHTNFNVVGTVTGRWAASDPPLQQIPKEATNKDAKKLFVARPGYELVMVDVESAELRVAASLAGDTDMMAALDEPGRSFHRETATSVFGVDVEPFYTLAKNLNYGIPYGIGPKKFSTYIAKGRKEKQSPAHYRQAKDAIDAHRAAWPALHQAIRNCTEYADLTGRLPLGWPGRFRHFTSPTMAWPVPGYQAFNGAVQGGVAGFMNDLVLAVEDPAAELGAELLLNVHDELWFEAPIGTKAELVELIQRVADDVNPFKMRMLLGSK